MIAGPVTEEHDIRLCYGSRLHCWSCHKDEPGKPASLYPGGGFPVLCYECHHLWLTPEDLLQAYNEGGPEGVPPATEVSQIWFCPLCIHDW